MCVSTFRHAQWRELVAEVGMAQLRHPFGPGQIAQFMGAQIGQPGVVRQPVGDQLLGRAGQHGLAAVRQIAQPGGPVDGRTDVVALVAQLHLPGVHADAQPNRRQRLPAANPGRTPPRRWHGRTPRRSCRPRPVRPDAPRRGRRAGRPERCRGVRRRPSSRPVGSATAASSPRRRPAATSPFRWEARP